MPVPTDITAGTISISGSTVTGVGTSFEASDIRQGDLFIWIEGGAGQWSPIVQTVTSNTVLTLAEPWTGPTISGARYRLRYQWDSSRVSAQSRQLIEMLDNGNVLALAGLTGPGVPVFDGPHSMTIRPEADFINGVAYDVQVDDLAARAAYDGQAEGFAVLVSDVGDGRSAVYSKATNTSGDWTDPAYVTGPIGGTPDIAAGTTTTLPPGSDATFTVGPDGSGGYLLSAGIPAGRGFTNRGAYDSGEDYVIDDVVTFAGSAFIAIQAAPSGNPPSSAMPPVSNAYWAVLAARGANGAGTVSSVAAGSGIAVDPSDPTSPVVSLDNVPTATVKGRVVAGTGAPTDLTGTQVNTILPLFGTAKGLVPSATPEDVNEGRILSASGAWVEPPTSKETRLIKRTNLTDFGSFVQGWSGWAARGGGNTLQIMNIEEAPVGPAGKYFSGAKLQLSSLASGPNLWASAPRPKGIDPSKAYSLGAVMTGGITATIQVHCYDENFNKLATLSIPFTTPAAGAGDDITSYAFRSINAQGGTAPAWPAGTVAAVPQAGFVSTGTQNLSVWALWLIAADEYPGNIATTALVNSGGGTHEAVSDDNNLYVLNHSFNWLVRYDTNLKNSTFIAIGNYPHDLVSISDDIWVTNYVDANIRKVSKSSFSVTGTYAIPGSKGGFGLATDGTRLWCSAGTTAQGPAVYTVNTSTGASTLLTNDIDGGGANIPIRYLDGSLWSIRQTPSEVKRINPATGATIATISASVGGIYGLGSGEGYVFANGRLGIAQIDVSTNTVVARYYFRETGIGHSNVEVWNGKAYACSATGVMIIDIAKRTQQEIVLDGGNNKWARKLPNGNIAIGAYGAPWMFVLSDQ